MVIPSERVQIRACLFLYCWYCPGVRLQIWVCLFCVISPHSNRAVQLRLGFELADVWSSLKLGGRFGHFYFFCVGRGRTSHRIPRERGFLWETDCYLQCWEALPFLIIQRQRCTKIGGAILLHFCSSLDPFFMQQKSLFDLSMFESP